MMVFRKLIPNRKPWNNRFNSMLAAKNPAHHAKPPRNLWMASKRKYKM